MPNQHQEEHVVGGHPRGERLQLVPNTLGRRGVCIVCTVEQFDDVRGLEAEGLAEGGRQSLTPLLDCAPYASSPLAPDTISA